MSELQPEYGSSAPERSAAPTGIVTLIAIALLLSFGVTMLFFSAAYARDVQTLLRAPEMIEAMIPQALALDPTLDEAQVTVAMTQVDRVWEQLFPAEQQRLVRLLVERVIVTPTNLELRLRPGGICSLAADSRQVAEAVA